MFQETNLFLGTKSFFRELSLRNFFNLSLQLERLRGFECDWLIGFMLEFDWLFANNKEPEKRERKNRFPCCATSITT